MNKVKIRLATMVSERLARLDRAGAAKERFSVDDEKANGFKTL